MIDSMLKKSGVGIALFLMVLELSYINAKSLIYMSKGLIGLDEIFGIVGVDSTFGLIGSLAFSCVTVLIMRLSNSNSLKVIFPIFDFFLVFCGYNLEFQHNLLDNPIRFMLSIFLAVFTGLITYSLGQINAEQHDELKDSSELLAKENELLKTKLRESESMYTSLKSNYDNMVPEYRILKSNATETNSNVSALESKLHETQTKLNEATTKIDEYKTGYLLYSRSRILKKNADNRTPEDLAILEEAELLTKKKLAA